MFLSVCVVCDHVCVLFICFYVVREKEITAGRKEQVISLDVAEPSKREFKGLVEISNYAWYRF